MKNRFLIGAATVVFVASTSASAFFLTDDDYAYLATQNFVRSESTFQNLGPRKEARLHALINEVQTKNALAIRAKIFTAALKEFTSSTLGGNAPGPVLGRSQVVRPWRGLRNFAGNSSFSFPYVDDDKSKRATKG